VFGFTEDLEIFGLYRIRERERERERELRFFVIYIYIYLCVCVCCKVERFVLSIEKEWCRFVQKRIRTSDRHKIYRGERERERDSIFNFIHIYIYTNRLTYCI